MLSVARIVKVRKISLCFYVIIASNSCIRLRIDAEEIDRLKVTHDVHHSWLKATPPLPPVMVMVMMMAVVTVVGSIELLYPSHHLAPHMGISILISEW